RRAESNKDFTFMDSSVLCCMAVSRTITELEFSACAPDRLKSGFFKTSVCPLGDRVVLVRVTVILLGNLRQRVAMDDRVVLRFRLALIDGHLIVDHSHA